MSADSWTSCPKCYPGLAVHANDDEAKMRMAEYYEFYIRDGKVCYYYNADCRDCSFGIKFEGAYKIPGLEKV